MTFHAVVLLRCLDDTSPEKNKTRILTDQKKEKVGPVKQTCGAETDVSLQGQQGRQGRQGHQGHQGHQGRQGRQGRQGSSALTVSEPAAGRNSPEETAS